MKNLSSHIFMFAKVYRTMTSGRQGAPPYFVRHDRELVSKPAISLKNAGGATVERLRQQGVAPAGYPSIYMPW